MFWVYDSTVCCIFVKYNAGVLVVNCRMHFCRLCHKMMLKKWERLCWVLDMPMKIQSSIVCIICAVLCYIYMCVYRYISFLLWIAVYIDLINFIVNQIFYIAVPVHNLITFSGHEVWYICYRMPQRTSICHWKCECCVSILLINKFLVCIAL